MSNKNSNSPGFDPYNFYTAVVGSSLTPEAAIALRVHTNKVSFPDGSSIQGNSLDYKENRYDKSASSYALFQGLTSLQQNINAIDPDSHFLLDKTVVTDAVIDPHFLRGENAWDISPSWILADGKASIVGIHPTDNYLKIPSFVFTKMGYYYLNVCTSRIDSGVIRIYDNEGTLISEVRVEGESIIELYIGNIDVMTLTFVAEDMIVGDIMVIESIGLFHVTERFRDYLNDKLSQNGLGETLVTPEQSASIATKVIDDAVRSINVAIALLRDEVLAHIGDRGNVHGLNADDLDVATRDHTHPEFEIMTGDVINVTNHLNDVNNPHKVTAEQIRAANISHAHTPSQCGAAAEEHDHIGQYVSTSEFEILESKVDALNTNTDISTTPGVNYPCLIIPINTDITHNVPSVFGVEKYITPPYDILVDASNNHTAYEKLLEYTDADTYNYYGGNVKCSKLPLGGVEDMVKVFGTEPVVFDSTGVTEIIRKFNGTITITGYTLHKSSSDSGYPSSIEVYLGDVLVDSKTISENFGTSIEYSLTSPSPTNYVRVLIRDQTPAHDGSWEIAVEIHTAPKLTISDVILNMVSITGINKSVEIDRPTFNHAEGTTAYVYLSNTDDGYTLTKDILPPDFDTNGIGTSLFEEGTSSSGSHPIWGTIYSPSEDELYPLRWALQSTSSTEHHFRSSVFNNVSIIYTPIENNPLTSPSKIYLEWSRDMINQNHIPRQIKVVVTGTLVYGSSDIETEMIVYDESLFEYVSYTHGVYLTIDISNTVKNMTKLEIIFNESLAYENQPCVALSRLKIYGNSWWANPYAGTSSDRTKMPITRVVCVDGKYVSIPYASSRITYVPMNNFNPTTTSTYVYNPYGSIDIDLEFLYQVDDKFIPVPDGILTVTSITQDKVHIDITEDTPEHIYIIRMRRRW